MEAVGQLAGGIAHDFNNLLTIVSGYARRLSSAPELASAHDDLEQILAAADRAAQLTRELLAFARRGETAASLLDSQRAGTRELEPMLRRLLAADIVFDFRLATGLPPGDDGPHRARADPDEPDPQRHATRCRRAAR